MRLHPDTAPTDTSKECPGRSAYPRARASPAQTACPSSTPSTHPTCAFRTCGSAPSIERKSPRSTCLRFAAFPGPSSDLRAEQIKNSAQCTSIAVMASRRSNPSAKTNAPSPKRPQNSRILAVMSVDGRSMQCPGLLVWFVEWLDTLYNGPDQPEFHALLASTSLLDTRRISGAIFAIADPLQQHWFIAGRKRSCLATVQPAAIVCPCIKLQSTVIEELQIFFLINRLLKRQCSVSIYF